MTMMMKRFGDLVKLRRWVDGAVVCCKAVAVLALVGGAVGAQADTGSPLRTLMTADQAKAWQAVGRVDMSNGGFCTGALIAPNLVLTAAHCVFDPDTGAKMSADELSFSAGWRQGRASAHRAVRRVVAHPEYDQANGKGMDNVGNDIAILELNHSIRNAAILPFGRADKPSVGAAVQVVSYARERSEMPSIEEPCEILGNSAAVLVLSCQASFGCFRCADFCGAGWDAAHCVRGVGQGDLEGSGSVFGHVFGCPPGGAYGAVAGGQWGV